MSRKLYLRGTTNYTRQQVDDGQVPLILTDMMRRSLPREDGTVTIFFLQNQPVYPGQNEWRE